jgi:hypothetical protein
MKRRLSICVVGFALAAVAGGLGGCASLELKTEHAIAWVRDALQTTVDAPLERVARASVEAVRDLKFTDEAAKTDAISGVITAKTAKDEKVTITLTGINYQQTVVDIRVGLISDKAVATEILKRINKNL